MSTGSGCPVQTRGSGGDAVPAKPWIWSRWLSTPPQTTTLPTTNSSECPVAKREEQNDFVTLRQQQPASIEEAAKYSQLPAPGQHISLSTQRVVSSIPRGEADNIPAHQIPDVQRWQYPSEQQFYNAMLRKGYRPPAETIPSVLQIHNAVNERSWYQVVRWEKELHNNANPKLVKFVGRPKDLSPKAWWNSRVLMTQEPFDRHDWYVEDVNGGEPRRYVIDFYEGAEEKTKGGTLGLGGSDGNNNLNIDMMKPPSMYIDVRPALDNPSAALDRVTMFARDALPGLASAWDTYRKNSSSSERVANVENTKSEDGAQQR